ncbi:unnamed protein product, partial [Sphacelaria rigidula]
RKRRKEGHLVVAVRLQANNGTSSVGSGTGVNKVKATLECHWNSSLATGELVFVEIGDGSPGDLPATLRTALAHLQV